MSDQISERQRRWDIYFLGKAAFTSTASKDPSTKVGAIIANDDMRPISEGFNGLPKNMVDDPEILNNRELKYRQIIHAEENSVFFAKCDLEGMTMFTYPLPPCLKCTSMLIQSGIKRVVSIYNNSPRWIEECDKAKRHLESVGIKTTFYDQSEILDDMMRRMKYLMGEDAVSQLNGHNCHNCEDVDE